MKEKHRKVIKLQETGRMARIIGSSLKKAPAYTISKTRTAVRRKGIIVVSPD
jgi:hypothetical protein